MTQDGFSSRKISITGSLSTYSFIHPFVHLKLSDNINYPNKTTQLTFTGLTFQ